MKKPIILFLTIVQLSIGSIQAAQLESPESNASLFSRFTSVFYSPAVVKTSEPEEITKIFSAMPQKQAMDEGPGTSPPVWLFYNRFCATVGLDPNIKITPLIKDAPGFYTLKVSIIKSSIKKQDAWATLLVKNRDIDGAILNTAVFDEEGIYIKPKPFPRDLSLAIKLVSDALIDNPLYSSLQPGNPYYAFFIEFKKQVVQFYGDNMGDCRGLTSEVAALSFLDSLNLQNIEALSIGISTAAE